VRVPCERDGKHTDKYLAFAVDCNARFVELDPFTGGAMAIAEVCRNLVCSGAEPIGITDCLNFGNPERPEVMETFARAIDGLAAGCSALGVPIVSGNVSLYNETDGRAILPTPSVAAVGLIASTDDIVTQWFKRAGDVVLLLGGGEEAELRSLSGSEYLQLKTGKLLSGSPAIDLDAEAALQKLVLALARAHLLESAHDVAEGGLAVALAECATTAPSEAADTGARVDVDVGSSALHAAAALFGEAPSRVVASVKRESLARVLSLANAAKVPVKELGVTGGDTLSIAAVPLHDAGRGERGERRQPIRCTTKELRAAREKCLESIVGA
jgi:phosphoribosylformylglycinamidine synthase